MSGVIDIPRQSLIASLSQQLQQVSAFSLPRSATRQDYQAGELRLCVDGLLGELKEMRSVAANDNRVFGLRAREHLLVSGRYRQDVFQDENLVSPKSKQMRHLYRHIVVEKKLHAAGPAICSATSASISIL